MTITSTSSFFARAITSVLAKAAATPRVSARISEPHPWRVLLRAEELARDILAADFGELYGTILPQVSSGEIARLIGECPVGWRRTREEQ